MSLLTHIITTKQVELAARRRPVFSFSQLRTRTAFCVGEIKPRSPSKGLLIETENLQNTISLYTESAVDMISVLTDTTYFGGSAELFSRVRTTTQKPLLRKEFIIDTLQIYESLVLGADALLLIASILSDEHLREFIRLTHSLGMDALVECHTEEEVARALAAGATTIGINNRNLDTLTIDLTTTERLRTLIPPHVTCITESGIESDSDIHRMKDIGVHGFLIGTSFLQAPHPKQFLSDMLDTIHL